MYNKLSMLITDMVKYIVIYNKQKQLFVGFIIVFNFFTDIAFLNSLQQKTTRNTSVVERMGFLFIAVGRTHAIKNHGVSQ